MSLIETYDSIRPTRLNLSPEQWQAIERSLFDTAVGLYARATTTSLKKDGDRGSISVAHELPADLRKQHDTVTQIRRQVVAHVYPHQQIAGSVWHEQKFMAVETPLGWQAGSASRQTYMDEGLWRALQMLTPTALEIITRRTLERINAVSELLNDHKVSTELLEGHLVDPVEYFGSLEAAMAMMPWGGGVSFVEKIVPRSAD